MAPVLERRRRDRRRDRSAQMCVLALALLAGIVAAIAGSPRGESATNPTPASVDTTTTPTVVLPARTWLFGHYGPDRRIDLLVAFGWNRGATEGTALLIPSTTMVEVPSLGPQALADVLRLGSAKLLEVVVENALGVRFDGSVFVSDTKLARVLAPSRSLRVELPQSARIDDSAGIVTLRAGRRRITPAIAMRLLSDRGDDELSHLVAVSAVLDGWRAALARESVARATVAVDRRLLPLVIARSATVDDSTLPVERLSSAGEERFRIRSRDAADVVRQSFPWALIANGRRPRVEVLNGVGGVGVTQQIALRIVPAGGEVTLTGNLPGFGARTTRVVYYRSDGLAAARRMAAALGVGKIERATNAIDVVDLTIIVGKDFERRSR